MIEVDALTKKFAETVAVRDVSFKAGRGEILGVLGPNGAGKTTILRVLCGYLRPTSGAVRVDGWDVVSHSIEVRRRIGYLPENNPLHPEMRTVEYLRFRAGLKGVPRRRRSARVDDVVQRCGLSEVIRQTIGTLSKGYRQRVGLADALVADPPLLVLDEPTSGLDPNQVLEVRELVRGLRQAHTVLFSSHQLHEVEHVCDRVVIFRRGRVIAEDTTASLRSRAVAAATVTLEAPAAVESRLPSLIEGIARLVSVQPVEDGWVRATVEAAADPRTALFERAAAQGIILRELTRRQLSLEEVFAELTVGDAGEEQQ
jgi:ABC-2 type transport system ATP-binding protein